MRKIILLIIIFIVTANKPALATVQDVNVIPPPPPAAPSSVSVQGITDTMAEVSWAASESATQYSIFVNGTQWAGSNAPGVTLTGLKPLTDYDVYVLATNAGGSSSPSVSVSFTTLPPVPTAPETPTISNITDSSASLTWNPLPVDQAIEVYRLYLDGQFLKDVLPGQGLQSTLLDNLTPGSHTVAVTGVNDNKEGPRSPTTSFTVNALNSPEGLTMTNHSDSSVWLNWQQVRDADFYLVYLDGSLIKQTEQTAFVLTGLSAASAHQVSVIAGKNDGNMSANSSINVQTLPIPEPISGYNLERQIFSYLPDLQIYIVVLFSVVAALSIAKTLKGSFYNALGRWRI